MEVVHGDRVLVVAHGSDAQDAIRVLAPMIESGLNEEVSAPAPVRTAAQQQTLVKRLDSDDPNLLHGVAASSGLAVGKVFQLRRPEIRAVEKGSDAREEQRQLEGAIAKAKNQLEALRTKLQSNPMLTRLRSSKRTRNSDDPDLHSIANSLISKGKSAAFAWREALRRTPGLRVAEERTLCGASRWIYGMLASECLSLSLAVSTAPCQEFRLTRSSSLKI
jgi:phosphocarrier protein FPr